MSSTTITRGNSHETFYIQPSLTPVSVAANTTAVQTFSVPGLQTTDIVTVIGYNVHKLLELSFVNLIVWPLTY